LIFIITAGGISASRIFWPDDDDDDDVMMMMMMLW